MAVGGAPSHKAWTSLPWGARLGRLAFENWKNVYA